MVGQISIGEVVAASLASNAGDQVDLGGHNTSSAEYAEGGEVLQPVGFSE